MTVPLPVGTTKPLPLVFGDIDTHLTSSVLVDVRPDVESPLQPPVTHNVVHFELPSLVVVDGVPLADPGNGLRVRTKAGVKAFTQVVQPLEPVSLAMGSYARWLPRSQDLSTSGDIRYWWPMGWARDTPSSPRMALKTVTKSGTGQGSFGPNAPQIEGAYTYQGFTSAMRRPAMVFDGAAVAGLDPGSVDALGAATLAIVAVFRPSLLNSYGIYEAQLIGGDPLDLRYTHGRVDIHSENMRVMAHQTIKPAHYPVILFFSFDASKKIARVYCLDKSRSTRQISLPGMDSVVLRGNVGALGQGTLTSPLRHASEMDLLELDIWTRALSFEEMESKANLMSLAYGVAG